MLQALGLSFYEAKALETLLPESLTAKELSAKAKIPLGKVYSVVLALQRKGLVSAQGARPERYGVEHPSAVIEQLIQQKEDEHERVVTKLRDWSVQLDLLHERTPRFFQVGVSLEEQRELQSRLFGEAEHEVCQLFNTHHVATSNRLSKSVWEQDIKSAINRGVVFRALYPLHVKLPVILSSLSPSLFFVRRVNTDLTRCDIADQKKVLLKIVHPDGIGYATVILIENRPLARTLQASFENLWDRAGNT